MNRTGFAYHPIYMEHFAGAEHPERPERLSVVLDALDRNGLRDDLIELTPSRCERKHIERVHTARLIDSIEQLCRRAPAHIDADTAVSEKSFEVALYAAGAGVAAADAIMDGTIDNAFCAVRPPGHHAESDRAMGFCLFNSVAVTARYLQSERGVGKVLVIDWDVHHGNGTQEIFYEDPTVLLFSSHQYPYYPGTGSMQEGGAGAGETFTVNAPMNAGCGDKEYMEVYSKMLPRIAGVFEPDFVLISAGFDAHANDPLAAMRLTDEGYAGLTQIAVDIARKHCGGRLISMLEGGYDEALGTSSVAHIKELIGRA